MNPAFAYVYDDFLGDAKYERAVAQVETELARRGIEGRIARLAMFRNAKELVSDLVKQGVLNVVFMGNDRTLEKVMWFLPDLDVTVGYVPMEDPARVAELLGIPKGAAAVDVLAARLVEVLDVGKLDDRYFLTEVVLPATVARVEIEGQYTISPMEGGAIAVRNLGSLTGEGMASADPKDGWLEAVVQTKPAAKGVSRILKKDKIRQTVIRLQRGAILSDEPVDVFMDGHVVNGFRFSLSVVPKKLKIITGRNRKIGNL